MQKQTMFLATLCLLIGPAAVPSQAQTGGVNVNVPFKFEVGDRTLPDGQYLIWSARDNVFIQRSDQEGSRDVLRVCRHSEASSRQCGAKKGVEPSAEDGWANREVTLKSPVRVQ